MALSPNTEIHPLLEAEIKSAVPHYLSTPTPFGVLFRVPAELRLKIYRELVIAGSVRFLESSKAIHSEAIDVVPQEGVCRLEFNVFKPLSTFPVHDFTSPILNLEIRLNFIEWTAFTPQLENPCIKVLNKWLSQFIGCAELSFGFEPPAHPVPRKSCKILLDCHSSFWKFDQLPRKIFDTIRHLTGFETLVLAVAIRYTAETRQRMIERMYEPRPDPRRNMASAMRKTQNCAEDSLSYRAHQFLEPTLGPAKIVWGRGEHLEFHPRTYNANKIEGKKESLDSFDGDQESCRALSKSFV